MANCLLLSLPEELSEELLDWTQSRVADDDVYGKDGKGIEHNHHITAAHGIDDENIHSAVERALRGLGPIKVRLGEVGFFCDPDKDYHVLKVSIEPGEAEELHERIVDGVSMYNPTHDYHPHITLAYVNQGACQDLDGLKDFAGREVEISSGMLKTEDSGPKRINFGGMHGADKQE